jgi:ribosome-associated toxin RatA of RatAB toxin-antitoxin module
MTNMNQISLQVDVAEQRPAEVFAALRDFAAYPKLCRSVRSVQVKSQSANEAVSDWEVNFQAGILKWRERDLFNNERREIAFEQIAGDIDHFSGLWRVVPQSDGSRIHFDARFDLGIPMLSDMLDPVAKKAIEDNIHSIIHGLFLDTTERALS